MSKFLGNIRATFDFDVPQLWQLSSEKMGNFRRLSRLSSDYQLSRLWQLWQLSRHWYKVGIKKERSTQVWVGRFWLFGSVPRRRVRRSSAPRFPAPRALLPKIAHNAPKIAYNAFLSFMGISTLPQYTNALKRKFARCVAHWAK